MFSLKDLDHMSEAMKHLELDLDLVPYFFRSTLLKGLKKQQSAVASAHTSGTGYDLDHLNPSLPL